MSALNIVGFFLISLIFSTVIFCLWVRIGLRYFRVSSLNPVSTLAHTITNPLIQPIYFVLKQKNTPRHKIDAVAVGVLICVEFLKIITFSFFMFHALLPVIYIFMYVLADLIIQPCNILFYAILIRAIMSFIQPNWHNPIAEVLVLFTEPLLALGRKIVPDISGFDFSPFIIMMILKVITLFISASLPLNIL